MPVREAAGQRGQASSSSRPPADTWRTSGQAPAIKDLAPLPLLEIIPHADVSDRLLAYHRENPDIEDSMHLHYRGHERPKERAPFFVRINGPGQGEPNPKWRSIVPRVEVLDQNGQAHGELWAGFYGLGRIHQGGGAAAHRTGEPPSAVDRDEAAEFAFLLLGEHRPWEHVECTVRAFTEDASATLDVVLTPALPHESFGFGNGNDSGPWCMLQVPFEIPVSDVEVVVSQPGAEIETLDTWNKLLVKEPEFPRFGHRTLSATRVMSWTWNALPRPLKDASLRVRVRFPSGFVYERTLIPGGGSR